MPALRLSAAWNPAFDRRAFFVIVPGFKQHEWKQLVGGEIFAPEVECISKRLAATGSDMPIESPRSFTVIEAGPSPAHDNLVRVLGLHRLVESAQILLAPVTAVCGPSLVAWVDPGIEAVECVSGLTR